MAVFCVNIDSNKFILLGVVMETFDIILLTVLIFIGALLYSSVGHGGASGYLAAMALLGLTPVIMKPVGLVLNMLVSGIAVIRFYKAKFFSWRIFIPVSLASIPFAYIGGAMVVPSHIYKTIAGVVLLYSAFRLMVQKTPEDKEIKTMPLIAALFAGAVIGFLSGLVGVGGGIFLSPLLLIMGWSRPKETSGIAAAFIFVNSASGFLGLSSSSVSLPGYLPYLAAAAIAGGLLGSRYGSRQKIQNIVIRRLLAVVLIVAGIKLMFV
jgi:uncharacterized membrane protein YfcA